MHVRGEGPAPNSLMIVGEGPGYQEDLSGRPFVGKTGDELNRFLNGMDVPERRDWFIDNLFRNYKGKDYEWTLADVRTDEDELRRNLDRVNPALVVTLGRWSTRWFLGDVAIEDVQGIPYEVNDRIIFPIVHPAAGFHSPEMSALTVDGFRQLAAFFNGQLTPRKLYDDPFAGQERYEEVTTLLHLERSLRGLHQGSPLAFDTEGWPGMVWSLQYSFEPGTGYLIRSTHTDLLREFNTALHRIRPRLIFHSALHDLGVGRELGIKFDGLEFSDTMVQAYLLGIEPKGLKSLCLRHANMKMQSFSEVMGDASRRVADTYLTWLWDGEEEKYAERQKLEFDAAIRAGRRVRVLPKLPRTDLQKAVQRCLGAKDPRANWGNQRDDIRRQGELALGPMPAATLSQIPRGRAIRYACRDADGTLRVDACLRERISALDLEDVYRLEISTYPLIDRMQRIGLKPDLDQFSRLSTRLAGELSRIGDDLKTATRREDFNPNSSHHVREFLFQRNGLESVQLTDSGDESTNDKVLEALEHEHPEIPAISAIREYREVYKLKSTFVDSIPAFVNRYPFDGRVHTSFRTTVIPTGRLAASDPNVLAQPEHGKFAKDFKRGWVADDGHVICAWDQSQIELRGLAHLSQDPLMLAVFRGERRNPDGSLIDLHAALAERIFGVKPKDQDKHKHRLPAKAVNFGISMGMTCVGLSVELRKNGVDADEDTAQRWIDQMFELYPGVVRYMDQRIAETRRNGYVRCLSGRIRYIGGIRSRDGRVRAEAERFAISTPIQESAQFIMKQAEAQVWNHILVPWWKAGRWVEPLVQIHDCLKMETEIRLASTLHKEMQLAMTCVPKTLSVPLAVEGEYGPNMSDMEAFR